MTTPTPALQAAREALVASLDEYVHAVEIASHELSGPMERKAKVETRHEFLNLLDATLSKANDPSIEIFNGLIWVGATFIWTPTREPIVVTRIEERNNDERRIWTTWLDNPRKEPVWNDESRFREAARPSNDKAPAGAGLGPYTGLGDAEIWAGADALRRTETDTPLEEMDDATRRDYLSCSKFMLEAVRKVAPPTPPSMSKAIDAIKYARWNEEIADEEIVRRALDAYRAGET